MDAFGFDPFVAVQEAAERFFTYLTGWTFKDVTNALSSAFDVDLFGKGVALIQSLWDGIEAKIGDMKLWWKDNVASYFTLPEAPAWLKGLGTGGGQIEYDAMGSPLPGKELGGPVRAGRSYAVGERGIELFTPDRDGYILSNRKLAESKGQRQGNTYAPTINVSVSGASNDARQIARLVAEEVRNALRPRNALDDGGLYT